MCLCTRAGRAKEIYLQECTECHKAGWGSVFSLMPRHWGKMLVEYRVCLESVDGTKGWWVGLINFSLPLCGFCSSWPVIVSCAPQLSWGFQPTLLMGWDVLPVSYQVEDGVQEGSWVLFLECPYRPIPLGC